MKVLGIHSSPIKNGNTAFLLDLCPRGSGKTEGVSAEAIALSGLTIADCLQCNWCMTKQTPEKTLLHRGRRLPILQKVRDCDVLVLASPVYFSRLSGTMACFIDRTRCFTFGKSGHLALKDKVGSPLQWAGAGTSGMEMTCRACMALFWSMRCGHFLPCRRGPLWCRRGLGPAGREFRLQAGETRGEGRP